MQIFLMDYVRRGFKRMLLEVESSDTICSVMAQVEDILGFLPPVGQRFHFGRSLYYDDDGMLADYKVCNGSTLSLMYSASGSRWYAYKVGALKRLGIDVAAREDGGGVAEKKHIFVRDCLILRGRGRRVERIVLEVEAGDTVAAVMAQVQGRLGYPPEVQCLQLHDSRQLLHDSGGTLADYGVRDGAVLNLDMNFDGAKAAIAAMEARKMSEESEGVPPVKQEVAGKVSSSLKSQESEGEQEVVTGKVASSSAIGESFRHMLLSLICIVICAYTILYYSLPPIMIYL